MSGRCTRSGASRSRSRWLEEGDLQKISQCLQGFVNVLVLLYFVTSACASSRERKTPGLLLNSAKLSNVA